MDGVSRSAVGFAGLLLIASAALGAYLGYNRAVAAPGGAAVDSLGAATPSIAAKTASAIPDSAPPPVPDETFIRKIAREEVQSALHPKKPAPAPDDSDDSADDSDADHPSTLAPPAQVAAPPLAVPPAPQ